MAYLEQIERFTDSYVDGRHVVDRFPPLIGLSPELLLELLLNSDLQQIGITISFTFANGGATYRVIAQESGVLIASCEASHIDEVVHGPD